MTESISASKYQHSLAQRYARQGAYLRKVKIDGAWVTKCFLKKSPKCSKKLLGMLSADGWECCMEPNWDYQRRVYTSTELNHLGC